jgi:hypothetical protein
VTAPRRRRVGQQVIEFRKIDDEHAVAVQAVEWSDLDLTIEEVPMRWVSPGAWVRDVGAAPC